MRRHYLHISLLFYGAWIILFILEGMYAAALPTVDLTTRADAAIPVVPEFVWIYVSCYVFPLVPLVFISNWHRFNIALAAVALCTLIAFIGHIALPVAFSRPSLGSSQSELFIAFIYANDFTPGAQNFPSLHVAIAWIIYFCSRGQGLHKAAEYVILLTAILIVLSTLLIKQHLLADAAGGTGLAVSIWCALRALYRRLMLDAIDPPGAFLTLLHSLAPAFILCGICITAAVCGRMIF